MKHRLIAFACLLTLFSKANACETIFKQLEKVERLSSLVEDKKPWETLYANS